MKLEKPSKMMKRLLKKKAPERKRIDTRPGFDRKKAGHKKQIVEQSKKLKKQEEKNKKGKATTKEQQ